MTDILYKKITWTPFYQLLLEVVAVEAELESVRDYESGRETTSEPGDIGDQFFELPKLACDYFHLYICFQVCFEHAIPESFAKNLHLSNQFSSCEKVKDLFEEVPWFEDRLKTFAADFWFHWFNI